MLKKSYKNYSIYAFEEKYMVLGKKFLDKKYDVLENYKNDKRSYVVKVKIEDNVYILKSSLNESKRKFKKLKTLLKKSESLTTLINITKLRKEGLNEFYTPFVVIEKKHYGLVKESFILTEYIEGKVIKNYLDFKLEEKQKIVDILKKIHEKGVYHGDANHGNFIFSKDGLRVIDTSGKKERLSYFKRNYDFITLDDCIKDIDKIYTYKKNRLSYWIAYFMKKYKKKFK